MASNNNFFENSPNNENSLQNPNPNFEGDMNASGSLVGPDISPHEIAGVRYGKCKWFNVAKGWGFLTPSDGGREVFVHQSVIQMPGFRSLEEQEDVEFECKITERGLEATRVSGIQGIDCHGSTFRPRTKNRHRRVRCYNCGAFNHIATKCQLGPQPKRCYSCRKDDHLAADCPSEVVDPYRNLLPILLLGIDDEESKNIGDTVAKDSS